MGGHLLRRIWLLVLCGLLLCGLLLAVGLAPAGHAAPAGGPEDERILVVTTPALRWADLVDHDLPNLEAFLGESSVAMLSLRTIGARTSVGEGYATLGAGNRAGAGTAEGGLALEPFERFEEGLALHAFERRTGEERTGAVLHLAFPAIERLNNGYLYDAEPGALGASLADAGRSIGVVANADLGLALPPEEPPQDESAPSPPEGDNGEPAGGESAPEEPSAEEPVDPGVLDADDEELPLPGAFVEADYGRSAALATVDRTGQVPRGQVDGLLTKDVEASYGVRYDNDAVLAAFGGVWDDAGVDVAVVELSDLDRADSYRREADREAAAELWEGALRASDELFGELLAAAGDDTTVIVLSPSAPRAAESLGVFGMRAGEDGGQLAKSAATRRAGYVQLTDVAPTILDRLDVDRPTSMTGTVISDAGAATVDHARFEQFSRSTQEAVFRIDATGPVSVVFVVIQIIAYGLAAVAVARRQRWTRPVSFLALVVLATPPVVFGIGALHVHSGSVVLYLLAIFAVAVVLAALAEGLAVLAARRWPRTRALVAPLSLVWLTWLVLVGDIVTGGSLQIDTVFGYSPLVAGRFAGFGNLAFALVAIGAVVVACGTWAAWRLARTPTDGSARARGAAAVAIAAFLGLTVVVDGAPAWGADVGGVLATVPAFAVLVLVITGARLDWRRAVLIGVGTLVALSAFAAVDLARPEEDRTHLGRLVDRASDSGGGGLGEVLERKISSNIGILTSSIWTLTIPFALGLMIFLARRRTGFLRDLQEAVPGIRATLAGGLVVAVLGFALNDSGIAVPAMMFAVLLPYLTYVLLRWDPEPR